MTRHTTHAADGFRTDTGGPVLCDCGRRATWRRRRNSRPTRYRCTRCHHEIRTQPEENSR